MKAIELPPQSQEQLAALDELYRSTKDARLRSRAQMILLVAEQKLVAHQIAAMMMLVSRTARITLDRPACAPASHGDRLQFRH
jgi:hypothetical protein